MPCFLRWAFFWVTTFANTHWAFRRLPQPTLLPLPDVDAESQPIDQFIAAAQRQAGLQSAGLADRRTVVRRLFFDLIGLPPTADEVNAFLLDDAPGAFDRLLEQLLERPEFGERWGRHWMDVARYADSNGCSIESNNTYDNAWRYRDYVITARNEDTPYDQFVIEQIAGDLLSAVSDQQRSRQLIATGFLLLGPKAFGTSGFERFQLDVVDEQLRIRGQFDEKGDRIARRIPPLFQDGQTDQFAIPSHTSGRLQLAQWLVCQANHSTYRTYADLSSGNERQPVGTNG